MAFEEDYMEQSMMENFIAGQSRQWRYDNPVKARVERYSVSEDDIRNMLFETSIKDLCNLTETVLMEKYPDEQYDSAEWNKTVDIAAFGLAKKFLTEKQKWYLASFIIFYSGR